MLVKQVTNNPKLTKSDVTELEDQFFQDNIDAFAILKEELAYEPKEIAKDFIVTVVAGFGGVAANPFSPGGPGLKGGVTAAGAPVTVGGGVSAGNRGFS